MKQKGIITYGIAPNRQNPFAGAAHDAIFNTWRRFSSQVLYWAPPMIAGYYIMDWAKKRYGLDDGRQRGYALTIGRNEYLNSKAGRAEFGGHEE